MFEDKRVLVLDKPVGWSVMGERHDTDLVRLAQDSGLRLWPAHRIDKVTSGVVLFAKDLVTHGVLTRQFAKHTVDKTYLALTASTGLPERGTIELPLSVGRKNRVRVAAPREAITQDGDQWGVAAGDVFTDATSYPSTTTFQRLWAGHDHTLLSVSPHTGRRHQIRVHLAWIGHELVGDPLFTGDGTGRTGLHAWHLGFDGPDGERHDTRARPGDDFWALAPDADPSVVPEHEPH